MSRVGAPLIGLVGGIAPASTVAYYQLLIDQHRALHPESYPRLLINSIDLSEMLPMVGPDLTALTEFLVVEVQRLVNGGATVAAFASNTPHLVFDAVCERIAIPMVSIVEAAAAEAERLGYRRLGLLGTRSTMQASFYRDVFARRGMTVVPPPAADLEYVHHVYFHELVNTTFKPETREGLLQVIERLRRSEQIDAAILGGTELSLILTPEVVAPVPLLDTARIHVAALRIEAGRPRSAEPTPA